MRTVRLFPQVQGFIRNLAPRPRKRVRAALRLLPKLQGDLRELDGSLSGYHRLRVSHYRIILRITDHAVDCIFMERRSIVYELFQASLGE